jgi:putative pyrroloquinoline-quinone binding quinoprotein
VTDDFTARLERELYAAAERGERGTRAGRARVPGAIRGSLDGAVHAFGAAVAVGLVLVAAFWMVSALRPEPAAPPKPRVVADVKVADRLSGHAVGAFGSLWLDDGAGTVLRVDPRTRRVVARVHVGGAGTNLAAGHGSVWAMVQTSTAGAGPLLRIDPRTNRVVGRTAIRLAEYPYGWPVLVGRRVWVVGQLEAVGLDPATNRLMRRTIRPRDAFQFVTSALRPGELWLATGDGRVTRYDDRTGRRLGIAPWRAEGAIFGYRGGFVVIGASSACRRDPASGRNLWCARFPATDPNSSVAAVAGNRAYLVGQAGHDPQDSRDRLVTVDARDGRLAPRVPVPDFGTVGMVGSGRDIWLLTSSGRAVVVRP